MRNLIYHCRRIQRRLFEIQNGASCTQAEILNYEKYMSSLSINKSDYFFSEYSETWDMLQEIKAQCDIH